MTNISRSRRGFFRATLAGAATAAFAGPGLEVTAASAQTTLSPEAALQELIEGNRRFTEGRMTSFNDDLDMLKTKTSEQQEPFAAVLSCADSRVPVELIFDQSIGHLFVARVAGNIATSAIIASLEYSVAVLSTKAIMVWATPIAGRSRPRSKRGRCPGRSARSIPIFARPSTRPARISRRRSRPMPRSRPRCRANPRPSSPSISNRSSSRLLPDITTWRAAQSPRSIYNCAAHPNCRPQYNGRKRGSAPRPARSTRFDASRQCLRHCRPRNSTRRPASAHWGGGSLRATSDRTAAGRNPTNARLTQ